MQLSVQLADVGPDFREVPAAWLGRAEANLEDTARRAAEAVAVVEAVDDMLGRPALVSETDAEVDVTGGAIRGRLFRPTKRQFHDGVNVPSADLLARACRSCRKK